MAEHSHHHSSGSHKHHHHHEDDSERFKKHTLGASKRRKMAGKILFATMSIAAILIVLYVIFIYMVE